MKLVVVTYSTEQINGYLKGDYIVDKMTKSGDKLFFLLKKSINSGQQFLFTISTKDENYKYSWKEYEDVRSLNKYLEKDWKVIDIYEQEDKFLYLIQKQTLKQQRKEKLDRIKDEAE